jgi:hypothetical protein
VDVTVFFDAILPSAGLRCVAWRLPSGGWGHAWGPDNAWLIKSALYIDTTRNKDVYYGCSSFLPQAQDTQRDPTTRKLIIGGRKQTNVAFVRSFWVDLDVGPPEPGKPPKYANWKDAARAIFQFAVAHHMPTPWLVRSGWGVHAYWPMDADMVVADWKPVAEALKQALRAVGVLFDPSRTADESSVLRPPGTHNHKRQPKPVEIVAVGQPWTLPAMQAEFGQWVVAAPADPFAHMGPVPAGLTPDTSGGLTAGAGYDPSSAYLIADHCAVIGKVRDTRGDVDQPTWYNALGVLRHTVEAPGICHEWSKGHARYSVSETNDKMIQQAAHGPTGCLKFADHQPDLCAACPWNGKIKTPLVLGREKTHPATFETVETVVDKKGFPKQVTTADTLPHGYGVEHRDGRRVLTYLVPETPGTDSKPGKPAEKVVVSETFLVGRSRLQIDKLAYTEWEADTREGPRLFMTPNGKLSSGWRDIAGLMGEQEVYARTGKERYLETYLKHWMQKLRDTAPLVNAYQSFGWSDDGFVLGDTVLRSDGTEVRAVLGGQAHKKQAVVTRKGDLATWVALVDRAYNAPGQEAFQFQLACGFAAPLIPLLQQISGLTVYAHTQGSGVGKTTVQKVALSAWGNPDKMMLAQGHATGNALWTLLGAYNNLPIVYDELTNAPSQEVSELVFSVSSGRAKERLSASGDLKTNNANWSTIMLASGNMLLSEKLTQHRANTEAEIARLFEFTLTHDPHLSVLEATALFPQFLDHHGHAGHVFAKFVTENKGRVTKALRKMLVEVQREFKMQQVERHWAALFACVLVALHICRAKKLMAFEVEPIKAWMQERLIENRNQSIEAVSDYADLLSQMFNDLWPGVLVTQGQGDLRKGVAVTTSKAPVGPLIGRAVRGSQDDLADLHIARSAIIEWCEKRRASQKAMMETAVKRGWVYPKVVRAGLGRGSRDWSTTSFTPCWRFKPEALEDAGVIGPQLTMLSGGKP